MLQYDCHNQHYNDVESVLVSKVADVKKRVWLILILMTSGVIIGLWKLQSADKVVISAADPTGKLPLIDYIHQQNLPCLQCHQLTTGSYGPGFKVVARQYRDKPDATNTLTNHIVNGYGFMPSGLASQAQAEVLADKIMKLDK